MHAPDCSTCSTLDRAAAYNLLGLPHFIPVGHASAWMSRDLHRTLRDFTPGDEAIVDFAGEVPEAPLVRFTKGDDRALTATFQLADGTVTELQRPAVDDEPYPPMITATLQELVKIRGARAVIIIERP